MTAALAGVVLIYGAYNAAAAITYSSARDAHLDHNCSDAVTGYGRVTGFFALSLATPRGEAARAHAECQAVREAERERTAGDHEAAAESYEAALDANPESPIRATLEGWRGDELLAEAGDALDVAFADEDPASLYRAVTLYGSVRDELRAHPVAARARLALSEIEKRLYQSARTQPCSAVSYYDGLGTESQDWMDEGHPIALLGCANKHSNAKRYGQAKSLFSRLIVEYPGDALVTRARRGLIAAEVASIRTGRTGRLADPVIVGSSGTGMVKLTIQNSSPYRIELLLSGPDAMRLGVPACGSCEKYSRGSEPTRCSGPERSIALEAGRYSAVVRSVSSRSTRPWSDDWTLASGYQYDAGCFYIVTS